VPECAFYAEKGVVYAGRCEVNNKFGRGISQRAGGEIVVAKIRVDDINLEAELS
jgi:hypothetical protein